VEQNQAWNKAIRIPGEDQSNQVGEIAAIVAAASMAPPSRPLKIYTDSKYVINGLTENLPDWEDQGWIGVKNVDLFKKVAYLLKRRTAPTFFQWVKGHEGNLGNEESDRLAKEGAHKDIPDELDLEIPHNFDLQGAKLSALTQAIAYKGIQERKTPYTRQTTEVNLQRARDALNDYTGTMETDATLWLDTRNPNLQIKVQQYLYKSMHGTQKIGEFWKNIPGYEHRQLCQTCQTMESMEHILTECREPTRHIIWDLARNRWPHGNIPWPDMNIGIILGCGSISTVQEIEDHNPPDDAARRKPRKGPKTRLLQILISESAHLIWALRCERVIQEKQLNTNEITVRWHRAINKRLAEDKITATKIKRTSEAIQKVRNTWEGVLRMDGDLPHLWVYNNEVLVGRRPRGD
jgi:ribonuclease HI